MIRVQVQALNEDKWRFSKIFYVPWDCFSLLVVASFQKNACMQMCILLLKLESSSAIDALVLFLVEPRT